jgi:lipopolysaccharide/colanic/teichoic acid biosynthesis glycosyltransferase
MMNTDTQTHTLAIPTASPDTPKTGAHPLFDQFVALTGLILLSPLMILAALTIVIETGFPIFFSQSRLGQGGRRFRMYKFRKFPASGDLSTRPLTVGNDPRFTRVGKFLEKTKLDETPQLWNVLRGDMAIVGPRPEVPEFADCFVGSAGRVLDYKPGILGPSQAVFRNEGSLYPPSVDEQAFYRAVLFPAKASLDLAYYPSRTFLGDLKWWSRCLLAVCGMDRRQDPALAHIAMIRGAVIRGSEPPREQS